MRKKASINFLGEHTAGIVIGVVCFVILIFVGVQVYGFFSNESDLQKASNNLKLIKTALDQAKINNNGEANTEIFGPNDWWIISWPYREQVEKPYDCKGYNYCICICASGKGIEDSLNNCNSLGKCIGVNEKIKTTYLREPPSWYSNLIKNAVDIFGGDVVNVPIPIYNPPVPIKVKYNSNTEYEVISE